MTFTDNSDKISKNDLDIIFKVNEKAISLAAETASQNEEIIQYLADNENNNKKINKSFNDINSSVFSLEEITSKILNNFQYIINQNNDIKEITTSINNKSINLDSKIEALSIKIEKIDKEIFKLEVLFSGIIIQLIIQVIQFFIKK